MDFVKEKLETAMKLLEKCVTRMISDSAQYHDIELGMFSSEIEDSLNELKGINTDPHYNRYEEGFLCNTCDYWRGFAGCLNNNRFHSKNKYVKQTKCEYHKEKS